MAVISLAMHHLNGSTSSGSKSTETTDTTDNDTTTKVHSGMGFIRYFYQ